MASEEASYKIIKKTDTYEIRHYSDRLVVETVNRSEDSGFRKLFNYISGENNISEKIQMTIPVTQTIKDNEYPFFSYSEIMSCLDFFCILSTALNISETIFGSSDSKILLIYD